MIRQTLSAPALGHSDTLALPSQQHADDSPTSETMSHGWSDTDKQVAQKAAARAKSAAEAETLRLFHNYSVKTADDLWQLELQIREWRRDRQNVFTLNYAQAETQIANWISRGWLRVSDLGGFSPTRLAQVRALTGYRE